MTRRTRGISLPQMVKEVTTYLRGWLGYFGDCQTPSVLHGLERWLRRRLRSVAWKQWKRGRTRFRELRKNGAAIGFWRQEPPGVRMVPGGSQTRPLLTLPYLKPTLFSSGSHPWFVRFPLNPPNRRMRTRMYGGVAGEAG